MLSTERMRLEPVSDRHLRDLVALNSDPEVMEFQLGGPATPEETAAEWRTRWGSQSDPERRLGNWAGIVEDEFVASTSAVNTRSRRVLEKVGLQHVATQYPEWAVLLGADQGEVLYTLELGSQRF